MSQEINILKNDKTEPMPISEDMVVVGPGRMLKEAREAQGITQHQIAKKLNFRDALVADIEADKFDHSLPVTFNRGYLKNYAKLVNISQKDVLNAYEQLGVAQRQCEEMQSFSKETKKQAENNRLMWVTYLIVAGLVAATTVWWYQEFSSHARVITPDKNAIQNTQQVQITKDLSATSVQNTPSTQENTLQLPQSLQGNSAAKKQVIAAVEQFESTQLSTQLATDEIKNNGKEYVKDETSLNVVDNEKINNTLTTNSSINQTIQTSKNINHAVFVFSGDCWVNIYDATGKRIAWGIKKADYVMNISGIAPFNITLGKAELVDITYNDKPVDMTRFKKGNIAKFVLPM